MDTDAYVEALRVSEPLIQPVARAAIEALDLPPGSRGLDVGCGIGLQTLLLAEAVGPGGHVTGLDLFPAFLRCAERSAQEAGRAAQVSFREGDACDLTFDDHSFDWAWSANCVGYASSIPPLLAVRELARVVKPGGRVILLAWSSETLLPGYPRLEARLDATAAGIAPFVHGRDPELHFMRALGWFRKAGLVDLAVRTFAGDAHAPLADDVRRALIALFEMRWPSAASELSASELDASELDVEDRAAYRRLCRPESPAFILNHADYAAFFTYSMFHGTVATQTEGTR